MSVGYDISLAGYIPLMLQAAEEGSRVGEPTPFAILFAGQAVLIASTLFLAVGLLKMSYVKLDTGEVSWTDGWKALPQFPGQLLIALLFTLAMFAGFTLLVLPGLLAIAALWLSAAVYADPRNTQKGPLSAIRESWRLAKRNFAMSLVMFLALWLAQSAGSAAAGIGFLVTAPIAAIAAAMTKRRQEALLENLQSNLGVAQ